MGKSYDQLSLDERIKLAQLHCEGFSIREIASDLDRSPSTVARELKRNTGQQVGYRPAHAQEHGKRVESKMPSAACADSSPAKPIWPPLHRDSSQTWSPPTTTHPASVLTGKPQQRSF
jgi:IS30 family transposase